jgi:sensor histidine kinase regulating citrate/malate metabolism
MKTNNSIIPDKLLTYRKYKFHPFWEGFSIGFITFLVISLTTVFIYHHSLEAQKEEIREGLLRTAQVINTVIDGDLYATFLSKNQETGSAYQNAVKKMQHILDANEQIAYVYTLVLHDDKVYFVLDPTKEGDEDEDGFNDKVHVMDEYPDVSEEALKALKEHIPVVAQEPYQDQWGSFMGGFIPIFNSNKEAVGVLAVDITAENYFERLKPIKRATIRTLVAGFFISYLVAVSIWFLRNFSRVINDKRIALIESLKE